MYQSLSSSFSSSSTSQKSSFLPPDGSAPDPLFKAAADSAARSSAHDRNHRHLVAHYYSGDCDQSANKIGASNGPQDAEAIPFRSLLSQQSSAPGFLHQLPGHDINAGRVGRSSSSSSSVKEQYLGLRPASDHSHVSEGNYRDDQVVDINEGGLSSSDHHQQINCLEATNYYLGVQSSSSWGNSNCISFASPHETKRAAAATTVDATSCLNGLETDQFSVSSDTDWVHPEDSVRCKLRAKRGFATHPRSIAERERRIRISGKLKKLQELVPNMDKQSSYADMLDLAVDHIKGLQKEVQKLEKDLGNCSCGSKLK